MPSSHSRNELGVPAGRAEADTLGPHLHWGKGDLIRQLVDSVIYKFGVWLRTAIVSRTWPRTDSPGVMQGLYEHLYVYVCLHIPAR